MKISIKLIKPTSSNGLTVAKAALKKLDHKNLGPFEVAAAVGRRSFKLKLPPSMKVFDTFHTSLLKPAANDPLPGQRPPTPPPVIIERDGESSVEYEVNEVVDLRRKGRGGHLWYKLRWTNGEITEQPWDDVLPGSEVLVAQFHKNNPLKPGPPAEYKDKLELRVMGSIDESPHSITVVETALVMKAFIPVYSVARASAVMEQQTTKLPTDAKVLAVAVNEGDLWLLDVAGAPHWKGGVMSRSDCSQVT